MKLALLQMAVQMGDAPANREKVTAMVQTAAANGVDAVVLPETWNLGFFPQENLAALAEDHGGESRELLARLARTHGINVVGGSIITRRGDGVYNTAYVFDRQGQEVAVYDKIHGFSPSGEHLHFRHGETPCTFRLDGVEAGIIICYDLRFVELARLLALRGIQILFVPAQWPAVRVEHWQVLNRARAIENQMVVACVNGCGDAYGSQTGGHSMLISPFGEVITAAGAAEEIIYGTADMDQVAEIRGKINVFRDRKPQLYRLDP